MAKFKLLRVRKPSLKTALGVTKAKKSLNKALGITALKKPFRAPSNMKRTLKRHVGLEGGAAKWLRFFGKVFKG